MLVECDASRQGGSTLSRMTMNVLTPKIADITAEGLSLSADLTGEDLGLADVDVSIQGTVAVGLDFRAIERTIYVTGVVEGTAIHQCVRCLKDFDDPLAFSLRVAYEREPKATASAPKRDAGRKKKATTSPDVEPDEPNDDLYYFTGDQLELAPMLREQLILASPMHPLCSEGCLGLCARCGKDLNEGPCHCVVDQTGRPFQVLRTMKEKLRESGNR